MASNRDKILSYYEGYDEDARATSSRENGLEFYYTKKLLDEYITSESCVIELGCGTGYYSMYFADKCAQYTGVDLSPDNIAVFREKIVAEKKENIRAAVGDATALSEFQGNSFDVVLCLGPMYHLPQEERAKVFDECCRIARPGAILAFAYINGLG
ncbi:MAG: class I SAM-dependent methyltransferase, partial [Defluviitaleaceae bacterium]|nr:class I SAM-dependent methyltransferase [Defluviitaleaceae bacterium]